MSGSDSDDAGGGSVLGTHAHWAGAYAAELATFRESAGADAGEVWFGEETQATMVAFTGATVDAAGPPPGAAAEGGAQPPQQPGAAAGRAAWRVLDLGCGNGALSVALAQAGCAAARRTCVSHCAVASAHQPLRRCACSFARITGVDYVAASVELSREVAAAAGLPHLRFQARAAAAAVQSPGRSVHAAPAGSGGRASPQAHSALALTRDAPGARRRTTCWRRRWRTGARIC
jgi:hypothetical protein